MAWQIPRAGDLRDEVRFEREAKGQNVGGFPQKAWGPLGADPDATADENAAAATRAAKVEVTRGGEQTVAGRLQGEAAYDIWVRFEPFTETLGASDRAVNTRTGEVYAIAWIGDPNGRRAWLILQATSKGRI